MSPQSSKKSKKKKSKGGSSKEGRTLDVYSGLLFVGFLAVATGCGLLAVELMKYDWTAAS